MPLLRDLVFSFRASMLVQALPLTMRLLLANLGPEADDECHAYSDCVARNAWLGRESPLPADADIEAVAIPATYRITYRTFVTVLTSKG